MSDDTAVRRLHDALAGDPWAYPTLATTNTPVPMVTIPKTDAHALLKQIADSCEDHQACEECETGLCTSCAIGEYGCTHDRLLCHDCAPVACHECADDVADDDRTEAYADITGGRY